MAENKYQSIHKGETIDEVVSDYMKRKQGGINADSDILLDEEALRIQDATDNEYPMLGNSMLVLDIDTFNSLTRLQDGVLYVVTQSISSETNSNSVTPNSVTPINL